MLEKIKHVLIADDDPDDIELFKEGVKEVCPDISLSVAEDGNQLISLLDEEKEPDVIILDINMPRKDGKQCLREIRRRKKLSEVPVVILTTSNYKDDIDFCLQNGANQYLVKPKTFDGLKNLVRNICVGRFTND